MLLFRFFFDILLSCIIQVQRSQINLLLLIAHLDTFAHRDNQHRGDDHKHPDYVLPVESLVVEFEEEESRGECAHGREGLDDGGAHVDHLAEVGREGKAHRDHHRREGPQEKDHHGRETEMTHRVVLVINGF